VVSITLKFRKAARVDDALLVRTTIDAVSGARLEFVQTLYRGEEIIAEATVEACCISLTGRPKKPPPELISRLKPFLDPSRSMF
jgi:acyl-CoA thioester hydrolase